MKINLILALVAVLASAPMIETLAAEKAEAAKTEKAGKADAAKKDDAKKDDAKKEGAKKADADEEKSDEVTTAQLKARKAKKPYYTKFAEATAMAEKCNLPLIVALLPDRNPVSQFLQQKVLNRKEFAKDFAAKNCVLLYFKLKVDSKEPKKIETRGLKDPEIKFLENFGVSEKAIQQAKQLNKDEPKYNETRNYPAVLAVDSLCQKELFRFASYDKEGGFGVWLSQVVDTFRSAGIEPEISPLIQKICDNPDEPKKWK